MRDNIIAAAVVIAVIGSAVGGYWLYHTWDQRQRSQTLANAAGADSADSSDTSSASQNSNQHVANPNTSQSQVLSESTGNTTNNSSSSTPTAATVKPAEFGVYNRYKSDTSALYADIATGTGTEAVAGKKVSVTYAGWLTNGTIFDQTADPNKPFSFTLGAGSVITGWEQTIPGMKVGGERLLIIPPAVGYGNTAQGLIPANSVLIFRVKLVGVE